LARSRPRRSSVPLLSAHGAVEIDQSPGGTHEMSWIEFELPMTRTGETPADRSDFT
jgi:hypothetical protein